MISLHGYVKAKEYEVTLRTRCSLWCQNSSLDLFLYSKMILSSDTLRDTFKSDAMIIRLCQMASITSSISRSEHHRDFMEHPGVQSVQWISTSIIPQSFPPSMKGKHPITYSPELVRQRSMRDRNSSEGWSYFLIKALDVQTLLKISTL